jgi:hypothetical protein
LSKAFAFSNSTCTAYDPGNFDRKDFYGWLMLSDCLQEPEKLVKARLVQVESSLPIA